MDRVPGDFKLKYFYAQKILELENQFLNLKKKSSTMEEHINAFTDKMEFTRRIFPDELAKTDRYAKGIL